MKDLIDKYLGEGGIITAKYVVDMRIKKGTTTPAIWRVKDYGKPTTRNLKKYVDNYNESLKPGGVNQHIGIRGTATWAGIRENSPHSPYIVEYSG